MRALLPGLHSLLLALLLALLLSSPGATSGEPAAPGKATVLWPRIIPSAETAARRAEAVQTQSRLVDLLRRALPGRAFEMKPEPERRCPHDRCPDLALGVLLLTRGQGCAAVAMIHRPAGGPVRLVPWAGKLRMKAYQMNAGEQPEGLVTVEDFVPCRELAAALALADADVERELKAATSSP